MRIFVSLLIAVMPAALLSAQDADSLMIRRIADEILSNGKAYTDLRVLTKSIGGRLTASPQMYKAEKWGQQTLRERGADKVWLQECMVPHWIRGGKDEAVTNRTGSSKNAAAADAKPVKKTLNVLALGNSIGTGTRGIAADVIEVGSFEELEAKKDAVKGKIVFYNYKFKSGFVSTFSSYSDAVPYRVNGASRAAKYGARAVIVRSISHSTDNHPHTGSLRYDSGFAKIPAMAIGLQDADWLSAQLERNKLQLTLKTNARFLPDTIAHNVIGELTGSEFPDQYITVGGHLDSWDPGEGAHDDGAGIVQTIEILRTFKALGYKPRHTLRFVLFANEENGLRGGTKYAAEAKAKNEKHVFALESDAGGFTPRGFWIKASDEQFAKINRWSALLMPYNGGDFKRGNGGADIGPLNRELQTPLGDLSPDSQRYFDYHHAANDVFEAVNKRELELGAVNMAALIYLIDKYGL